MKSKMLLLLLFLFSGFFLLLSCKNNDITQVGDNTFIFNKKVYRVLNNELIQLSDLNSGNIRKLDISEPQAKNFETDTLGFIKSGLIANVRAIYRGNYLYYNLKLTGISDLKNNYTYGYFTLQLLDEYNFIIQTERIKEEDIVANLDSNNEIISYVYDGKFEISADINAAIKSFTLASSIKKK